MRLQITALIATTVALLLATAGCGGPDARQTSGPAAGLPPSAAPPAKPPAAAEGFTAADAVEPVSNTATAITGAAEFGDRAYRFARGQIYAIAPEGRLGADLRWSAGGGSWADLLGLDPGGEIELVRVTAQTVDRARSPNGSLCGAGRVRWIAIGRSADDVGAEVAMAAFSGARPPGPTGRDEDLCGTFIYAAGN